MQRKGCQTRMIRLFTKIPDMAQISIRKQFNLWIMLLKTVRGRSEINTLIFFPILVKNKQSHHI